METDGNGWKRMETVNDHVIKNDVCNTSELEVQHTFWPWTSNGGQGVQCTTNFGGQGLWAICKEPSLHRGDTERRADVKHCCTLYHYMNSNIYIYIYIIYTVFQHCVFHWSEFQFPIFDPALALPTRRVSGPNKASFSGSDGYTGSAQDDYEIPPLSLMKAGESGYNKARSESGS